MNHRWQRPHQRVDTQRVDVKEAAGHTIDRAIAAQRVDGSLRVHGMQRHPVMQIEHGCIPTRTDNVRRPIGQQHEVAGSSMKDLTGVEKPNLGRALLQCIERCPRATRDANAVSAVAHREIDRSFEANLIHYVGQQIEWLAWLSGTGNAAAGAVVSWRTVAASTRLPTKTDVALRRRRPAARGDLMWIGRARVLREIAERFDMFSVL
jgi:hypothetical protein